MAGLAADPGGDTVYALALTALYTVDPRGDTITITTLTTAGALRASDYTAMLAYPDRRLLLANVRAQTPAPVAPLAPMATSQASSSK